MNITKNKGITLIALIITIVILIILATVTLNIAFGEDGLIKRAEQVKNLTEQATREENEKLEGVTSELANIISEGGTPTITNTTEPTDPTKPTDPTIPKEMDEITEVVTTNTKVQDAKGEIFYIPEGFKIDEESANEVSKGIVITNNEDTKQFVWIPVSETDLQEMYVEEEAILTTIEGGANISTSVYSKLRDQTNGSVYDTSSNKPGSTKYREPDLITTHNYTQTYLDYEIEQILENFGTELKINSGTADTEVFNKFAQMLVDEYEATYKSIKYYGGFYIGRFELSGKTMSPTVMRGGTVQTSQTWYGLKKVCNIVVSTQYAQTTMIYGNQWDEVLDWLIDTGMSSELIYNDSSSWGNFKNSKDEALENSGKLRTSGYSDAWQANKIYDLAGNYYEFTQEARGDGRILRGGVCENVDAANWVASRQVTNSYEGTRLYTTRPVLYLIP